MRNSILAQENLLTQVTRLLLVVLNRSNGSTELRAIKTLPNFLDI